MAQSVVRMLRSLACCKLEPECCRSSHFARPARSFYCTLVLDE